MDGNYYFSDILVIIVGQNRLSNDAGPFSKYSNELVFFSILTVLVGSSKLLKITWLDI